MSGSGGQIKFLLKHSTIYGIGNLLSKIVSFLLLPFYTPYFTPAAYGVMELVDVTTGMIGLVVGIGVVEALSRFYYDEKEDAGRRLVVSTSYVLVIATAAVSALSLSLAADSIANLIVGSGEYAELFTISFISLAFGIVTDLSQVYFRLQHKSILYISVSMVDLVLGVSLNILFIAYLDYGIKGIFYSSMITRMLIGIPLATYVLRKVGIGFRWSLAKEMLAFSAPLIPSSIASTAVAYSDRYFLKYFLTLADIGIYGLGRKIGSMLHLMVTVPFLQVFLPRRFEIAHGADARAVFAKVFDYYLVTLLFFGLGLSVMADIVMIVMTTQAFYPAADLVPLVALTMVVLGLRYQFEFGILHSKQTRYYLYINISTACVHLILNFMLVGWLGMWGAMYASFLAQLFATCLVYIIGQRLYVIDFDLVKSAKVLALACGLFLLSRYTVSPHFSLQVIYKMALIASFPLALVVFGLISRSDVMEAKSVFTSVASKFRK